jgi:hypothetical protein
VRKHKGLIACCLLAVAIFLVGVAVTFSVVHNANASDVPTLKCEITGVTSYHQKNSTQYGPDQTNNEKGAVYRRFSDKFCKVTDTAKATGNGDALFAASIIDAKKYGISPDTAKKAQADAAVWVKDLRTWNNEVQTYVGNISGFDPPHKEAWHYHTFGMSDAADPNMPTLKYADESHAVEWVFVIHFKDGSTQTIRVICDDQPVEKVTSTPSSPQPHSSTTKPTTPDCHTSNTCHSPSPTPSKTKSYTCETSPKFGPGYTGTYPNCHKADPPGTIPTPRPSGPSGSLAPPADNNHGMCISEDDGSVKDANSDGSCPPGYRKV